MKPDSYAKGIALGALVLLMGYTASPARAADEALLDVLLKNGVITQEQYDELAAKETLTSDDILRPDAATVEVEEEIEVDVELDEEVQTAIDEAVEERVAKESPVKASYGSSGF